MCLAIPGKIESIIDSRQAVVDFMGVKKTVAVDLLENVQPGDYVIVHAGFAIDTLKEEEALETIGYFRQILESSEQL